ncbi:MAG TPA: bifunctional (p)ppGpp synthetase/guanosine-3',5'-bis(diphosphate) 3'-pyrophosphohydrolase [Desulfobulbaceae bacterium]|nr:MAG: GTP pyrophosphokinase [Deltaproteobacteria bacterium RIFOXYD12_FULL_53_23]HCC54168.1 bifunctional (p)ppGpp synthetase/guanosine-3',5'-bis(diphosphate) 3'-pyrophosphohydrolase [Desulfobulbaceae bacterium]
MTSCKKFHIADYCEYMEQVLGGQEGSAKVFWEALSFAVSAHQDQRRKSGEVYVSHPLQVAKILVDELEIRDPELLAAAVLHDTVEDVPEVTSEVIGEIFGKNIALIVDACTKIANFSGDKQTFYKLVHRKLFSGAAANLEVLLIKLADRLHNLRTMASMPKDKRQKIADETLDIYAPMAKIMGLNRIKRELYTLALMYKFPRQSQKVLAAIKRLQDSAEVLAIKQTLEERMKEAWITHEIRLNPRGLWAYFDSEQKVLHKTVANPLGFIIITNDIQTCYRILGVIHQNYPPIPRTIRDFIATPKATGYQSLHTRANIKGQNYLFKIRTAEMTTSSRTGLVREWFVHKKMPSSFEVELREMLDILGTEGDLSYREMIAVSGQKAIYTYTPKGDPIELPAHSIVLDFAFRVHTDVGKRCIMAKIGNRQVAADAILEDGDQVEIICQKEPVRFEPEIQQLCQTPRARAELSKLFRQRRESLARMIGESILRQELKRYGLPCDLLENPGMGSIIAALGASGLPELFLGLGEGRFRLRELIGNIKGRLYADRETLLPPTGSLNRIELATLDPVCIKFSRCCNPIPTENWLYGLLSERGLSVHHKECTTITSLNIQREDVVEVRWRLKETPVPKMQTILILAAPSRNRVLMMLGVAPEEMKISEVELLSSQPSRTSAWQINFQVDTLQGLKNILVHLGKTGMAYEFGLEQ